MKGTLAAAWQRVRDRADDAPYVAEFALQNGDAPSPPQSIRGLLMSHVVVSGSGHRLVTYWTSREVYLRERDALREALALPDPLHDGFPRSLYAPDPPWWKRVNWYTAFVSAVAFFGTLEALRVHYDNLFLAPRLHVQAPRRVPLDYIAGQELEEYFTVINRTAVTHRDVVTTVTSDPPGAFRELQVAGTAGQIPPGGTLTVMVRGIANKPGDGRLILNVKAGAGLVRSAPVNPYRFAMKLWPAEPRTTTQITETFDEDVRFDVTVESGKAAPKGMQCVARVVGNTSITGLSISEEDFNLIQPWQVAGEAPKQVHTMRWTTKDPLLAFRPFRFPVFVKTTDPNAVNRKPESLFLRCIRLH